MAGINDLSIELYKLIFSNYLSINDLFNCRLVNKKFKTVTYESVQKLVIGELDEFKIDYWFHNFELISEDYVINLKCFEIIRSKSIFNLGQYLKYLKIDLDQANDYGFDEEFPNLNNLINLECLEVDYVTCDLKLNLDLENLKNLKYLKLDIGNSCELNMHRLEKIQITDKSQIIIKSDPESIKHIIVWDFKNEFKQFKNIEIMELTDQSNLDQNLLSYFINLKQLKIDNERLFLFDSRIKLFKNYLIKLLEKREELNRDIDIYLLGVKIINKAQLKNFESCEDILEFQLDNYDLLDSSLSTITELEFSELNNLYDNLRNNLPLSFFNKYYNISCVNVDQYEDDKLINARNLNWFLNNLKYLRILSISNVLLDQFFFDNLPNKIRKLIIKNYKVKCLNINFDFILKFSKFIEFEQHGFDIDLFDLVLSSFLKLKYLNKFQFNYNGELIEIKKEGKSFYLPRFKDYGFYNELNYDELKEKLNELRSK